MSSSSTIKAAGFLAATVIAAWPLSAQPDGALEARHSQGHGFSYAPLVLLLNGPGRVVPFTDGQMLEVGRDYVLTAIADHGYTFANWNRVNVFTLTSREVDYETVPPSTNYITSVNYSPLPPGPVCSRLRFTMEPVRVLYETNGDSLTQTTGWQANFTPRNRPHAGQSAE